MAKLSVTSRANKRYLTSSLPGTPLRGSTADYTLERRVQRTYRALLFDGLSELFHLPAPEALDYLLQACFPAYFNGSQRERCQQVWQAEDRVEHEVPEVISRLPLAELQQVEALLHAKDLVGAIQLIWFTFRPILWRYKPHPADERPDDERLFQAAGLGRPERRTRPAKPAPPLRHPVSTSVLPAARLSSTPAAVGLPPPAACCRAWAGAALSNPPPAPFAAPRLLWRCITYGSNRPSSASA